MLSNWQVAQISLPGEAKDWRIKKNEKNTAEMVEMWNIESFNVSIKKYVLRFWLKQLWTSAVRICLLMLVGQLNMTSVNSRGVELPSFPVELDFEQSSVAADDVDMRRQSAPDVQLLRSGGRRSSRAAAVRINVPDKDDDDEDDDESRRRLLAPKPDGETQQYPSGAEADDTKHESTELSTTEPLQAMDVN